MKPTREEAITLRSRAAEMAAGGRRTSEIAEALGVAPRTVNEWRREEGFRAQVDTITAAAREQVSHQLCGLATKALSTLEEILDDPAAERWARLRAAENILSRGGFTEPGKAAGQEGGFAIVAQMFEQRLAEQPELGRPALPERLDEQPEPGRPALPGRLDHEWRDRQF